MTPPRVPNAFQFITHLGVPLRVFSPWRNALPHLAVPLLWLAIVGLLWRVSSGTPRGSAVWLWAMGGAWMLAILAQAVRKALPQLSEWAVLYEDGFARRRRDTVRAWRWEEVGQVFLTPIRSCYCHQIVTADGEEIAFTNCPDILGRTIREQTFAPRRERLAEAFERGDPLDFARFQVTRAEGVHYHGRVLGWDDLRTMEINGCHFVFTTKDPALFSTGRTGCLLRLVPDPDVLLDLARSMGVEADPEAVRALP